MKILFVAPRFHTNQYPTSKELIRNGHEVYYLVQSVGVTEDHSIVKPELMRLSLIGKRIKKRTERKYDRSTAESLMIERFVPSFRFLYKRIKEIAPDVVILRDRIPSTIVATFVCRLLRIKPVLLYNQTELYRKRSEKMSLKKRMVFALSPKVRFTIAKIRNYYDLTEHANELYVQPHNYFVPYVCPLNEESQGRSYFGEDGKLRLLCVGKFRPYKNQRVLVDAMEILAKEGLADRVRLTMIGQAKFDEEIAYREGLIRSVNEKGLADYVTFRDRVPYSMIGGVYAEHDVFILTSKAELASISILEAMANSVMPLSTSYNGTVTYINAGENGLIFRTDDPESLAGQIKYLISDHQAVERMGANGYEYVKNNCMFENYFRALNDILVKEFSVSLDSGAPDPGQKEKDNNV